MDARRPSCLTEFVTDVYNDRSDVQEGPPTADQLTSILEYLGPSQAGGAIKGATGSTDAMRKFKASESAFQRPLIVDWHNGRAGEFSTMEDPIERNAVSTLGNTQTSDTVRPPLLIITQ